MTEYESWYQKQVVSGKLPDKDGYYHYSKPQKDYRYESLVDILNEEDETE